MGLRDMSTILTAIVVLAIIMFLIWIITKAESWSLPGEGLDIWPFNKPDQPSGSTRLEGNVTHQEDKLGFWEWAEISIGGRTVTVNFDNSDYWIDGLPPGSYQLEAVLKTWSLYTTIIGVQNHTVTLTVGTSTRLDINFV